MTSRSTLPWIARALLRCLLLGDRRADATADIAELFAARRAARGWAHAHLRLLEDLTSLALSSSPTAQAEGAGSLESLTLDLRYGIRLLRRNPGVIGATVGGLALAIAVGTSVFTILNASVMRSYGMDDPTSVVRVQMQMKGGIATDWPYTAFLEMSDRARQSRVIAVSAESVRVSPTPGAEPMNVDTLLLVSGQYLTVLGGRAVTGRTLLPSDDEPSAAPAVVLNHRFWKTRLDSDPAIVGKTLWLSGSAVTVVGVIDAAFTGPADRPPAVWATFGSYGSIFKQRSIDRTSDTPVSIIARVDRRASRAAAEQELSAIAASLPNAGIRSSSGSLIHATGARLDGAASPMDGRDATTGLIVISAIMFVIALVLALACANVANLLLAGAALRGREISVRLALGATRRRILRQMLTESLFIGLLAGAAGLMLSMLLVPVAVRLAGLPATLDVAPDLRVLLFAMAMAVVSGVAAGISPARYGARRDLIGAMKLQGADSAAPTNARTRRVFIGFQAAASTLLVVTAALFVRAAVHLVHVDLGFDADQLVGVTPVFPRSGFDAPAIESYFRAALERVRAMPSVEQAALTSSLPLGSEVSVRVVPRFEQNNVEYLVFHDHTSPEYFSTAGLRVIRGRTFGADDVRAGAPVAVVSESIARDFFSGDEPIGASLAVVSDDLRSLRIIGVVADAVTARMRGRGNGVIYQPLTREGLNPPRIIVRSSHPELIARDLEAALRSVDPRVRLETSLIRDNVDRFMTEPRILAGASGVTALVAVVLAVVGIFGVTTFVVHQRMREMQVRRAIGASGADITRLLLRQSLLPVVIGLAAGTTVVLPAARVLAPVLYGISPYDPTAVAGSLALLTAAAFAAVVVPAVRAARVDPAALLRA